MMNLNNGYVPTPPPAPETVVKGYHSDGYSDLINSLSYDDRLIALNELTKPEVIRRAEELKAQLAKNELTCAPLETAREKFLAALLLLQRNEISKNQLATLHIVDSAVRTLNTNPLSYLTYSFEENNTTKQVTYAHEITRGNQNLPGTIFKYKYNSIVLPDEKTDLCDLPSRMQQPLVKRFFNFTESEWNNFIDEMSHAPESEKDIHILVAPEFGCWSTLIFRIQDVLDCMQMLDWMKVTDTGYLEEKIMVVPSFSMFQAALNVKAKTLNRKSLELVPTYYYVNEDAYCKYKAVGRIPMTLYLPEYEQSLQYKNDVGMFRTTVDGHQAETAFAGAIHDEYHAFRELQMAENIAAARLRLASIAKHHGGSVSTSLMDGELIFSYPISKNTLFKSSRRPEKQVFGHIFYCASIRGKLSDNLKRAFIADMVEHADEWRENFNLGQDDLFAPEARIYDEIKQELSASAQLTKMR